jgi:nucleoside-diphosphate-sugar epimerase
LYARSKGEAAAGMHAAARSHGLRFSWGRIFLPYGPFDAPHRLVPSVIDALLEGTHAHCSPGRQVRDFVHVADVARALIDLAQSDADGPVDIGTGIGCSVHDAAEMIARQIGRQDLLRFDLPGPFGEPDRLVASPSRPAVLQHARSLEIGFAQTIAWHRARIAA